MNIIILAAGRGSRLGTLANRTPKALVKIGESSCFEHQLKIYQEHGYTNINVVTGYLAEKFNKFPSVKTIFNSNWSHSNMLTSLLIANENLKPGSSLISYGDIIFENTAIDIIAYSTYDIAVLYDLNFETYWRLRSHDPLQDLESFRIQSNGLIYEIGNKPFEVKDIEGQYMGILKISSDGWAKLKTFIVQEKIPTINNYSITEFLNRFILNGGEVFGIPYTGKWCEIDTYKDLIIAQKIF